jgi:glutaredoxin
MPILSVTNTSNEKKSCQVITTNDLASLSFESLSSCSKLICNEGFTMETASRAPAAQSKQHCSVEEADKEKSATATQYVNLSQDLSSKTVTMDLVTSSASISSTNTSNLFVSDDTASDIKEQNTADSPHIVVLVSTGVSDRTKATATLNLLNDLDLPYKVIDGRDPLQYEKRDKLFKISGSCNYPQIFISERGTCRYLGDYGQLEASVNEWTNACGMKYESKLPTLVHEQSSNGNDPSAYYNGHLTLLVSNGVVDYIQASNQKAAMQLLTDFSIPYKIVDGMDPSQLDKRNELFKISRIRGNYPQLFVFDESGGQHRYLGSYDWLDGQSANDLASILGGAVARSAD